jgi:hypothetical protein
MIEPAHLHDLVARWWFNYDEGHFDVMEGLLTDDVHFTVRTDTGRVSWAEFATGESRGREQVMTWQISHRGDSPYPLRHHGTNVHIVEQAGDEATFASYIHVTHVADEMPAPIPGGIVTGSVRQERDGLRIAALHVVLDTETSQPFNAVRGVGA